MIPMSLTEQCMQLERSLVRSQAILQEMLQQLLERRLHWASARPQQLRPSEQLEQLAEKLAAEENEQRNLLQRMSPSVSDGMGVRSGELHLNVSRLAAKLPTNQARSLKAAAAGTTKLAGAIRTEVMLGERLLRFTLDAQDRLFGELAAASSKLASHCGYDHRARARTGQPGSSARLVDGRV